MEGNIRHIHKLIESAHNRVHTQSVKAERTEPQSVAFGVWGCNWPCLPLMQDCVDSFCFLYLFWNIIELQHCVPDCNTVILYFYALLQNDGVGATQFKKRVNICSLTWAATWVSLLFGNFHRVGNRLSEMQWLLKVTKLVSGRVTHMLLTLRFLNSCIFEYLFGCGS